MNLDQLIKELEEAASQPVGATVMLPRAVLVEAITQLKDTKSARQMSHAISGSARALDKGLAHAVGLLLVDETVRVNATELKLRFGGVDIGAKQVGDWRITVKEIK